MSDPPSHPPGATPLWRRLLLDVRQGRAPGWLRVRQEAHYAAASARAALRPPEPRGPEIHVFVLWSKALVQQQRILDDVAGAFRIREVSRVRWPVEEFSRNLTRFYGGLLPPRAEKERHCGTDPFLVVVVEDPDPVYRPRRTPAGIVNAHTFDAKQRHRSWTGGGHRIHASLNAREAEHDLVLLLGRTSASYLGAAGEWDGEIADGPTELKGARGWQSVSELLEAIDAATPYVLLAEHAETDGKPPSLELLVVDRTRAALTANAPIEALTLDRLQVDVAGAPLVLVLTGVGDGSLARRRQRALLERRVVDPLGRFVAGDDALAPVEGAAQ